ncbi:MAG TPA: CapA family protein, partial [Armatimonadota bacterium]|nr:CapA family protein [Armatimonadota bacterium]
MPAPVAWLDPALPEALAEPLRAAVAGIGATTTYSREGATLVVAPGVGQTLATWFYAVVAPFPTLADEVTWEGIEAFWHGDPAALSAVTGDGVAPTLLVSEEILALLGEILGAPSEVAPITVAPAEELVDLAWEARPSAWSVVPFDMLEPRWKALRVDGLSLLDKTLDTTAWPLQVAVGVEGQGAAELTAALGAEGMTTNRVTEEMTVLIMTGVTAMVRGTAHAMETRGILFPAQDIGETLASADLTHISNELPFYSKCPPPSPTQESLVFCSSPAYMELLRAVGTDIVELTGNHFQDYGDAATLETIDLYDQEGWPYYGGGVDLVDASEAITLTSNGNTLSFIGCNPVGPEF